MCERHCKNSHDLLTITIFVQRHFFYLLLIKYIQWNGNVTVFLYPLSGSYVFLFYVFFIWTPPSPHLSVAGADNKYLMAMCHWSHLFWLWHLCTCVFPRTQPDHSVWSGKCQLVSVILEGILYLWAIPHIHTGVDLLKSGDCKIFCSCAW